VADGPTESASALDGACWPGRAASWRSPAG